FCIATDSGVAHGALQGAHSGSGLRRNHPIGWGNKKNKYNRFTDLNIRATIAKSPTGVNLLFISLSCSLSVICTYRKLTSFLLSYF
ncbi:hypothetical protein, partial [Enterobacter hormaechei]|uniref:hypothetical protein n=1 Tax=Enterobacter hormaechei TaxID=158836 RepID=UPI001C557303